MEKEEAGKIVREILSRANRIDSSTPGRNASVREVIIDTLPYYMVDVFIDIQDENFVDHERRDRFIEFVKSSKCTMENRGRDDPYSGTCLIGFSPPPTRSIYNGVITVVAENDADTQAIAQQIDKALSGIEGLDIHFDELTFTKYLR